MPESDLETMMAELDSESQPSGFAIAPGTVINNLDLIGEGRVQVPLGSGVEFYPVRLVPIPAVIVARAAQPL